MLLSHRAIAARRSSVGGSRLPGMPAMSMPNDQIIAMVITAERVNPRTKLSFERPCRRAATVGISNSPTTTSSSQFGPAVKRSGSAK